MRTTTYDLAALGQRRYANWQFPASPETLDLFLQLYAIRPVNVTAIAEGTENQTFLVACRRQHYVLRVYRSNRKPTSAISNEIAFMQYLGDHDVPVPSLIRNNEKHLVSSVATHGTNWNAILMTYMSGTHPSGCSKQLLGRMARLQAQMHVLGDSFARLQTTDLGYRPMGIRSPRGYCHMDLTFPNILIDERGHISAVLDFDDATVRPLIDCLVTTLWRSDQLRQNPDLSSYYVSEYEAVRPLRRAERFRLRSRLALRGRLLAPLGRRLTVRLRLRTTT
jgi:Ser/Thr protein kinase RdoA (MazF antagonist)